MGDHAMASYRLYWIIWAVLLVLTVVMLFLDESPLARNVLIVVLVGAMLAKVILVAGYFMHLRFETFALGVTVIVGLLITGAILFVLIAPDAYHVLELSGR